MSNGKWHLFLEKKEQFLFHIKMCVCTIVLIFSLCGVLNNPIRHA